MKIPCLFAILLSSCSNPKPDFRGANWKVIAPQKPIVEQAPVVTNKPAIPTAPPLITSKPVYVGNGNSDWEAERDAEMSDLQTRMLDAEERISEMENE